MFIVFLIGLVIGAGLTLLAIFLKYKVKDREWWEERERERAALHSRVEKVVAENARLRVALAVAALTEDAKKVGTMTLAVMTRASLGHTGRAIEADRWIDAIYVAVTFGALLRVAAPLAGPFYLPVLVIGGLAWSGAFLLFVVRYAPVLVGPRVSAA